MAKVERGAVKRDPDYTIHSRFCEYIHVYLNSNSRTVVIFSRLSIEQQQVKWIKLYTL